MALPILPKVAMCLVDSAHHDGAAWGCCSLIATLATPLPEEETVRREKARSAFDDKKEEDLRARACEYMLQQLTSS
eukprot:m.92255 g.92255  ORF g.92255 m.92255 type:complete len:76 (-) comp13342_c0_seq1:264-491(-)